MPTLWSDGEGRCSQALITESASEIFRGSRDGMLRKKRTKTVKLLETIVREVNATVRGWAGYFHYHNCSRALKAVKYHVEERLRTHLRKRHKIKDRGTGYYRFGNRTLYGKYGLYKVPTTAGWTKAHALS